MIRFTICARPVGLGCVGSSYRGILGPDIEFYRKGNTVCIPGSSLKGALRSSAARIAEPYKFSSCGQVRPEKMQPCDVCELFGFPNSLPNLMVSDLEPRASPRTIMVTRVKLDDRSLKAEEGGLYTQEHAYATEFTGEVIVLKPDQRLLGLLLLSVAELRLGRVGRDTLLDLKLENTEALEGKVDGQWMPLLNELKEWLWGREK